MAAKYMWVYSPTPVKLDKWEKQQLLDRVASLIEKSQRLKRVVYRTHLRGGRLYLYNRYEPKLPKSNEFQLIKPLIEGKYFETPLARITLYDKAGTKCALEWQRYNDQWITVEKGNLEACLKQVDLNSSGMFD